MKLKKIIVSGKRKRAVAKAILIPRTCSAIFRGSSIFNLSNK